MVQVSWKSVYKWEGYKGLNLPNFAVIGAPNLNIHEACDVIKPQLNMKYWNRWHMQFDFHANCIYKYMAGMKTNKGPVAHDP